MSDPTGTNPTPQFGTAEYIGGAGDEKCQFCRLPISGTYYRVNGVTTCAKCAATTRGDMGKGGDSKFFRALAYGAGAAIAGMVLYAAFEIATNIVIGYLALAVGWMVGKAMMAGSGGVGGRRYQIAAAVLTYASISLAAVPVFIHFAEQHQKKAQARLDAEQQAADPSSSAISSAPRKTAVIHWGPLLQRAALFGLASPLLELRINPFGGLISLVILFVGIRIAVRLTAGRPAEVFGPFDARPQASP